MKTLGAVMLFCALLGMVLFDLSPVIGILLCLLAGALILVPWILKKRLPKSRLPGLIGAAAGGCFLLTVILCPLSGDMAQVNKTLKKIDKLLADGQGVAVLGMLEEMPEYMRVDDSAVGIRYSQAYDLAGDPGNAQHVLDRISTEERSVAYYIEKMAFEIRDEQYREAMDTMKEAASLYPYNEDVQFNAGFLCYMRGEFVSADFYLQRLYDMDVRREDLMFTLGVVKFSLGEYEECETIFAEAMEKDLDDQMQQDMEEILRSIPYREG